MECYQKYLGETNLTEDCVISPSDIQSRLRFENGAAEFFLKVVIRSLTGQWACDCSFVLVSAILHAEQRRKQTATTEQMREPESKLRLQTEKNL